MRFILLFGVFYNLVRGQDPNQLLSLLSEEPAKGEPWPNIPGPHKSDRVCVVGAGASGVHMAASLKKRGFDKVVIFEKTDRVGGKCYDIYHRGVPQSQGANIFEANYFNEDSLIPFIREYGLEDDVTEVPLFTGHWVTNSAQDVGSKLTPGQFGLRTISKFTNSTSIKENIGYQLDAVVRYIKLHKEMFGLYDGDLMRRPTPDVMYRIRGTIMEFLTRENLLGMVPIFHRTQTLPGYGYLDEVSALYGLIWHNPRLVLTSVLVGLKKSKSPFAVHSFKSGYENIWKTVVKKDQLDIRFHVDILNIFRNGRGVFLRTVQNFETKTEQCDFLIWTPVVTELMKVLSNPTSEESRLLGSLRPEIYYAHLIDVEGGVRHAPTTAFAQNFLGKKGDASVTWTCDTEGLLNTPLDGIEEYNNKTGTRSLYVIHDTTKSYISETVLKEKVRRHLIDGFEVESVEFLNTIPWTYFPRWTPNQVSEGRHWDVFGMQGLNKIWYAGVSASYESVRSVVSYNNRLLKQMIPRKKNNKPKIHRINFSASKANSERKPTVYYTTAAPSPYTWRQVVKSSISNLERSATRKVNNVLDSIG